MLGTQTVHARMFYDLDFEGHVPAQANSAARQSLDNFRA
jgi:hypothetical protein